MNESAFFSNRKIVFITASLCGLLWGSVFPAIKVGYGLLGIGAGELGEQILFAGYRFFLSGLALLAFARFCGKDIATPMRVDALRLGLLGLVQTGLQYACFYVGLANTGGAKASILHSTSTFFSVILAHFIYSNDRLSFRKSLGCLFGFAGVVLVNHDRGLLDFSFSFKGDFMIVAAAFLLSVCGIYGKAFSKKHDPTVITAWQLTVGGALLIVAGLLAGRPGYEFSPASFALLLYLTLVSSAALALWMLLLAHNRVSLIAPFSFLIPVSGVWLSGLLLGEHIWKPAYALALAFVCAGIWLSTSNK